MPHFVTPEPLIVIFGVTFGVLSKHLETVIAHFYSSGSVQFPDIFGLLLRFN